MLNKNRITFFEKHLVLEGIESIVRSPFDGRRFKNATEAGSSLRILSRSF